MKSEKDTARKILGETISELQNAVVQIREEQDEHLQTINENTEEIASGYEYLMEVEQKVEKLSAKVDVLQMMVRDLLLSQIEVTRTDDGKTVKLSQFY